MVARVARREGLVKQQLVGTHSSGFHFPLLKAAAAHRLRQAQMDSGGFRVVVFWVSSCTTTWHNYIFDL